MKAKILLAALVALVLAAEAASAASPVNGTDRANGARACSALRTSLGASTFGKTYGTNASRSNAYGMCVSQWVQKARDARIAATNACQGQALTGEALRTCIASRTSAALNADVSATKNAAKECAGELKSLGATAFAAKYGTNPNKSNAFGKCVSSKASSKSSAGSGNSGGNAAKHFSVALSPLNDSGASGSGTLLLNKNQLIVKLAVSGLESGQTHAVAIRGLSSGNAACPTAAADTNKDGMISLAEGQATFGDQLLALDAAALSGQPQTVTSSLSPLQSRTIVVLGKTVNGAYDATVPVACGTITTS